jgi:hypothetical protein
MKTDATKWEELSNEAIADAGEWKGRARKAEEERLLLWNVLTRLVARFASGPNDDEWLAPEVRMACIALDKVKPH